MKKTFVIAFLFFLLANAGKAQTLVLNDSFPGGTNTYYATAPTIHLDSLTGNLDYSFIVHNPVGLERDDFIWGGTQFYIDLFSNFNIIATLVEVNTETSNVNELAPGQVEYSGSVNLSSYYGTFDYISVLYSNFYSGTGWVNDGYYGSNEYVIQP